jgi:hypothetical protein
MRQLLIAIALVVSPALAHAEGIVVLSITCAQTPVGPKVQGELKNDTNRPLELIKVTGSFRDREGKFINKGEGFVDFRPLMPGQISPFGFYGDRNPLITNVTAIISQMNAIVSSSGVQQSDCR